MRLSARTGFAAASYPGGALDSRRGAQAASVRTATRRVALRSFELPVAPSTRAADAAFHRKAKSGRLGALDSRCFIRPVVAQRTMDMLGNHRFLAGGCEMAELGAQQWVVKADWVLWPSFES